MSGALCLADALIRRGPSNDRADRIPVLAALPAQLRSEMIPARADHNLAEVQRLELFQDLEQRVPTDSFELVVAVDPSQERVHSRAKRVDVAELLPDLFVGVSGRVEQDAIHLGVLLHLRR